MRRKLDVLGREYLYLLDEFQQTGDFDIFADFDSKLYQMMEISYNLSNAEERFEITNGVTVLKNGINSLSHSAH